MHQDCLNAIQTINKKEYSSPTKNIYVSWSSNNIIIDLTMASKTPLLVILEEDFPAVVENQTATIIFYWFVCEKVYM